MSALFNIPNDPLRPLNLWASRDRLATVTRRAESGPSAERTFEENVKDAFLPGGVNGLKVFEGTLVSSTPFSKKQMSADVG